MGELGIVSLLMWWFGVILGTDVGSVQGALEDFCCVVLRGNIV